MADQLATDLQLDAARLLARLAQVASEADGPTQVMAAAALVVSVATNYLAKEGERPDARLFLHREVAALRMALLDLGLPAEGGRG